MIDDGLADGLPFLSACLANWESRVNENQRYVQYAINWVPIPVLVRGKEKGEVIIIMSMGEFSGTEKFTTCNR